VKSDAALKVKLYYSLLHQYASDPSRVELNDRIKDLFVDGQGSVYNDVYSVVYNNPVTNSDILNYVTAVGAYKNKSGGYSLNIEVNENSFQYNIKDANTIYVTVSKRVFCRYGTTPTDFVTREVVYLRNNKIVCIFKEGTANIDIKRGITINNVEFGSCYKNNEIIADFGSTLYARDIPYLNMRISYTSSTAATVYVKIIDPQGKLSTGESSPSGYTTKYTLSPSDTGMYVSGWGNDSKTSYRPGSYTVEIWSEGQKLYSKNVYLYSKGATGSISDVKVSFEGDDIVVKTTFTVQEMLGKDGLVSCYFYDLSGIALKDINSSYSTTAGEVAVSENISPGYDNSKYTDFEVRMPKSELHQSGTYSRSLQVQVLLWDKSSGTPKELARSAYTAFSYTPAQPYLSVSQESFDFDSSGGVRTLTVNANQPWEISIGTASWGHTSISGNTITLKVDENYGEGRSDYFKIKSGTLEKRINITQSARSAASAEIDRVWLEHDIQQTGYRQEYDNYYGWRQVPYTYKVMRIHIDFVVRGLQGKQIRVCAYFYDDDGNVMKAPTSADGQYRTPNGQLTVQQVNTSTYENSRWSDYVLDIPCSLLTRGESKVMVQIHYEGDTISEESKYAYFTVY